MIYTLARSRADISKPAAPNLFIPVFLLFIVYGVFSQYLEVSIIAGTSLAIIFQLFWKPYAPPALLYIFGIHWLQLFASVLYADYKGDTIPALFQGNHPEFLLMMSFTQLTLMALAANYYFKKNLVFTRFSIFRAVSQLDTKKVIIGYFIFTTVFPIISAIASSNASVSQLVQAFAVLRYVFPMLLAFILFTKKDKFNTFIICILILEFLLGFASFFSSFKVVIFFVGLVYLTVYPNMKVLSLVKAIPVIIFLASFMIFWQAVKGGYREFLNGGNGQQSVTVSTPQALGYLWEHAKTFDKEQYDAGTEEMIYRTDAIKYYYRVYDRVPSVLPYAGGEMFRKNLMFLTVPRSLNPDKGIVDASVALSYYTGQPFKTAAEGTAIAMGYFCDFYVDFGIWGMFIPLILIGAFIGWGSNYILNSKKYNTLFTYSLLIGILISFGTVENDTLTFLGTIRNFVVLVIVGNLFIFPFLNKQITINPIEETEE